MVRALVPLICAFWLVLGAPAHAASLADCPALEKGTKGSSPDTAVALEEFEFGLFIAEDAELAADLNCRWIKTSGFLAWSDTWGYLAQLRAEPLNRRSYLIESFGAESKPRSEFAQRRVTLVGKLYDACRNPSPPVQKHNDEIIINFGGPCHYGPNNGVTLAEVSITAIQDNKPLYILGEANRFAGDLVVRRGDRAEIIVATRAWVAVAQRGAREHALAELAKDRAMPDTLREWARANIESPHSYVSYLDQLPAFKNVNVETAEVEVLQTAGAGADKPFAIGCMCLKASCKDEYPLFSQDADAFLDSAVCTSLDNLHGRWVAR